MLYYNISMQAGYALAVDKNVPAGPLVLSNRDTADAFQLWEVSFVPCEWNNGIALINKETGLLAASSRTEGGQVVQQPVPNGLIPWDIAWQTKLLDGRSTGSVMPCLDVDLNLNAKGSDS